MEFIENKNELLEIIKNAYENPEKLEKKIEIGLYHNKDGFLNLKLEKGTDLCGDTCLKGTLTIDKENRTYLIKELTIEFYNFVVNLAGLISFIDDNRKFNVEYIYFND